MGVLEVWLERKHLNAEVALNIYRDAWRSAQPPASHNTDIETIKELIFWHATQDYPFRLLRPRSFGRLLESAIHLSDEDRRSVVSYARTVAFDAAENALRGRTAFAGNTSLASHLRTVMRKDLRTVCEQYGIPLTRRKPKSAEPAGEDPSSGGPSELADLATDSYGEESPLSSEDEWDRFSDEGRKRANANPKLVGILEGGHGVGYVTIPARDRRVIWDDLPPSMRCVRRECGQPRSGVSMLWRMVAKSQNLVLAWVGKPSEGFPYCSLACERLFLGTRYAPEKAVTDFGSRSGLPSLFGPRGFAPSGAQLRQQWGFDVPWPWLASPHLKALGEQGEPVLAAYNALQDVGRAAPIDVDAIARATLSSREFEVWQHRDDGYGSVGLQLMELAAAGINMKAGAYRQMRSTASAKVDEALRAHLERQDADHGDTAQRVFDPFPELLSEPVNADQARRILAG